MTTACNAVHIECQAHPDLIGRITQLNCFGQMEGSESSQAAIHPMHPEHSSACLLRLSAKFCTLDPMT